LTWGELTCRRGGGVGPGGGSACDARLRVLALGARQARGSGL
jgi:hypothetical protein